MKLNFAKAINDAKRLVAKHSPEILTGIGIAGMAAATVLAVQATPKAVRLMEEAKEEKSVDKLSPVDTIKATWKCYIPAAASCIGGAACIIGAQTVSMKRGAALAAAYKLSETALTEYREQVVDTIGEAKEKVVREKVAEKQLEKTPVSENTVIKTSKGHTRCFDPLTNRYFESDLEIIRRAENTLNKRILQSLSGYASINDFYDELDLPHADLAECMGWNADNPIDLDISAMVAEDGEPVIVVGHHNPPKYDFY
jgi:hypothetical protein